MVKNKIVALGFALAMGLGSVRAANEQTEISATRRNVSKGLKVASIASIVPTVLMIQSLFIETKGDGLLAKAKIALIASLPAVLSLASDIVAKKETERMAWNTAEILAVESAVYLFVRGPESALCKKLDAWMKSFAKLGASTK